MEGDIDTLPQVERPHLLHADALGGRDWSRSECETQDVRGDCIQRNESRKIHDFHWVIISLQYGVG